jgi:hypothetical protein
MKESNNEDVANHIGLESCECSREGALEALTGETAGRTDARKISGYQIRTPRADAPTGS